MKKIGIIKWYIGVFLTAIALVGCGGGGGGDGGGSESPSTRSYTVIDLGTLGGNVRVAIDINNQGAVVGVIEDAGGLTKGFIWDPIILMRQAGSGAHAINESNAVVGDSGSGNNAYRWTESGGVVLLNLRLAFDINDQGQIVGEHNQQAYLYDGTRQDLGFLSGGTFSSAHGINAFSMVVGVSETINGSNHAFIWDPVNGMAALGMLPGSSASLARKINDSGIVVGEATNSTSQYRAVIWDQSLAVRELAVLAGTTACSGRSINESGSVVGICFNSTTDRRAVLWDENKVMDLNALIPVNTGWRLEAANAINNSGQIVGHGMVSGNRHAFLLTPSP